jgi:hypothetical protein
MEKYKIRCKSILLQKSLEKFLENYIDEEEGVVIGDYEGDIIIGKDIKKPFSKSSLLIQLEALAEKRGVVETQEEEKQKEDEIKFSFEEKLDFLIDDFSKKLKQLIKEEYGKK